MYRNKENYIYNISSKYISQSSTLYHIIACKKLVTLSIAYLIQDVKFWVPIIAFNHIQSPNMVPHVTYFTCMQLFLHLTL